MVVRNVYDPLHYSINSLTDWWMVRVWALLISSVLRCPCTIARSYINGTVQSKNSALWPVTTCGLSWHTFKWNPSCVNIQWSVCVIFVMCAEFRVSLRLGTRSWRLKDAGTWGGADWLISCILNVLAAVILRIYAIFTNPHGVIFQKTLYFSTPLWELRRFVTANCFVSFGKYRLKGGETCFYFSRF